MKQTFLIFSMLVVAAMSVDENFVERLANGADMTKEEVMICVNKTSVTVDLMHFDQIVVDDLNTIDFDDKALKAGCLFACIAKKKGMMTGAHVNIEKVKEIMNAKAKRGTPDKRAKGFQILDLCADRVRGKTNECEVTLKFVFCCLHETQKYMENDNKNDNENDNE
ncbi:PREDICTED: pheromone-binding protein Gp-9-like isoform X2 [Dinoponera quadriceps]|uniref:Pheromone-binding protein Gp-9-like isoform X2 n=1 Tax=Dinoponera quadriceps TaxID=609295 RepID=A0A6P3WMP6_DINQU|nr:PREDICTED: pheromone-binding protein Gp-9-like isoform X2 [Dinoponera quadriceps]